MSVVSLRKAPRSVSAVEAGDRIVLWGVPFSDEFADASAFAGVVLETEYVGAGYYRIVLDLENGSVETFEEAGEDSLR